MDEDDEKRHEGFDEKTSPSNHKWSEHDLKIVRVLSRSYTLLIL